MVLDDNRDASTSYKRQKLEVYKQGTIKQIKVNNFMTYGGTVTIRPGPRLNLVLGPNGTGKSSLVCAICVGLGGSTKVLGRADNLSEFIRRGQKACWTEITLSGGPGKTDHVLKRSINAQTNGDTTSYNTRWELNGQDTTAKNVKDLIASLNIQFDNLCQFLPQDKVSEFANLTSKDLLEATQKAIGDGELYGLHQKLIELKSTFSQHKQLRDNFAKELNKKKDEHKHQQRDYERFEAREALKNKIDLLNQKILWLQYRDCMSCTREAKEKRDEATAAHRRKVEELQEDNRPLERLEHKVEKLKSDREAANRGLNQSMTTLVSGHSNSAERAKQDLDEAVERKAELVNQSHLRTRKLQDLRHTVEKLKKEISEIPISPPPELIEKENSLKSQGAVLWSNIDQVNDDLSEARDKIHALQRELTTVQTKLSKLSDPREQRLRAMEGKRQGIFEVLTFISQNRNMFRGPVQGPVGLEMNTRPEYAPYVEAQVSFGHLFVFVVSCRQDEEALSAFIKSRRFNFQVATVDGNSNQTSHPVGPASQFARAGVECTLDEVVEAPDLIRRFLIDVCKLNMAYVCKDNADLEAVQREMNTTKSVTLYKKVQGRGIQYQTSHSRYVPHGQDGLQIQSKDIDIPWCLAQGGGGAAFDEFAEERNKLVAEERDLETKRRALEKQAFDAENKGRKLKEEIAVIDRNMRDVLQEWAATENKRKSLGSLLKVNLTSLEKEKSKPEPLSQEGECIARIKDCAQRLSNLGLEGSKLLMTSWSKLKAFGAAELAVREAEVQAEALRDYMERRRQSMKDSEAAVKAAEIAYKREAQALAAAKERKDREAPGSPELEAEIKAAPHKVEEVEELVKEKEVEADKIVCANANVFNEFRERQKVIVELEKQVDDASKALEEMEGEMAEIKGRWLPLLTNLVSTIDTSFGNNFKEIGCAGEVALAPEPLRDNDYAECAIQIRVKFRENEELQLLTRERQSGGERSVSTLLYLIALQAVTVTPFRVIDEINQGMDPINERKVFTQLVDSSCRPDTPQCFLLTPKLLPSLTFTSDITILQIMNGAHIEKDLIANYADKKDLNLAFLGARALHV